jgi:hypothetical protein
VNWSGLPTAALGTEVLNTVKIQRTRQLLARANSQSELLNLGPREFLQGSLVASKGSIIFREVLTITTIWGEIDIVLRRLTIIQR